jgi:hypothetical protein
MFNTAVFGRAWASRTAAPLVRDRGQQPLDSRYAPALGCPSGNPQRCPSWVGVASRMLNGEAVGVILRSVTPARWSSSRYSRSVRSRLPVKTSIVVSKRVASEPAVPWGITTSTRRTLPVGGRGGRQRCGANPGLRPSCRCRCCLNMLSGRLISQLAELNRLREWWRSRGSASR